MTTNSDQVSAFGSFSQSVLIGEHIYIYIYIEREREEMNLGVSLKKKNLAPL